LRWRRSTGRTPGSSAIVVFSYFRSRTAPRFPSAPGLGRAGEAQLCGLQRAAKPAAPVVSDADWDNTTYGNFNLLLKDCTVGVGCSGNVPDALSSDALPASFDLGMWDRATGSVQIPGNDGGGTLSFTITSIVPEPGTGLLLGMGLVALGALRRR
jgi:hypothetical protein